MVHGEVPGSAVAGEANASAAKHPDTNKGKHFTRRNTVLL
jgi:hypothetical protein